MLVESDVLDVEIEVDWVTLVLWLVLDVEIDVDWLVEYESVYEIDVAVVEVVSDVDSDELVDVETVVTLMLVELSETEVDAVTLVETDVLVAVVDVLVEVPPTVASTPVTR